MLLEIGLLKRKTKTKTKQKKQKQNKTKVCCSNGYVYHFLDYIKLLLFVNANVIHHVEERGAFIGENAKGTHGEIYKSHTSVISTHFVDQVQIFFFLTHCKVRLETNC